MDTKSAVDASFEKRRASKGKSRCEENQETRKWGDAAKPKAKAKAKAKTKAKETTD